MKLPKKIAALLTITLVTSSAVNLGYVDTINKVLGEKLVGAGRWETAIEVSKKGWEKSEEAIIVNDSAIADALAATPFADAKNAPILLTGKDSLNEKTKAELKRLGVKKVYIIGGVGTLTENVENLLKSEKLEVDRIHGENRELTAIEIAKRLNQIKDIEEIAVVNGSTGLADAVSIAAAAADKDMAIILSNPVDGTKASDEFIKNEDIKTSYIIGGEQSVSKEVADKLPGSKRIKGNDRNETNTKVIETFYTDKKLKNAYVAKDGMGKEDQLIDALASGVLAAKNDSPVIIVGSKLSEEQKSVLGNKKFTNITQVGGNGNEYAYEELLKLQEKYSNIGGSLSGSSSSNTGSSSSGSSGSNTKVPVSSVSIINDTAMELGHEIQLDVNVNPSNATNKDVTWTSSDESVATVDEYGVVKAIGRGTAIITVTTVDGNKEDKCNVTVVDKIVKNNEIIQDAIDEANSGDTIMIENGEYNEKLTINKDINLIGQNKEETVLKGTMEGTIVGSDEITNLKISNMTIEATYSHVYLGVSPNITSVSIDNVIFNHTGTGSEYFGLGTMYFFGSSTKKYNLISITNSTFNYPNAKDVDNVFVAQTGEAKKVIFSNNIINAKSGDNHGYIRKGFELSGHVDEFIAENNVFYKTGDALYVWLYEKAKDSSFTFNNNTFNDSLTSEICINMFKGNTIQKVDTTTNITIKLNDFKEITINAGNIQGTYTGTTIEPGKIQDNDSLGTITIQKVN